MVINLNKVSPFYAAYLKDADAINAVIEKAAAESAKKMGASFSEVFSIQVYEQKKAA